ncbi:MAG: hypothetical protein A4E20_11890 [Nitrospira sp. SG-bin2]|uniref:hypothetical protein n=1 Tax=Nitrospira cf. moscoviensis SBR1015 TaxID=96242 RepID=UPI000A0DA760|nr:hypothetical protein [Nitrospira cf. moscoviensis SBR1015]OQW34129.1 MAG: hypothetical protein A4E20_11890 [Nitrospira sp. SG-bin2]
MICGVFPCCEATLMLEVSADDQYGKFMKDVCEECGATVYHYLSHWMPYSITEAQFNETYEIDEETKSLKVREGHTAHEHVDAPTPPQEQR